MPTMHCRQLMTFLSVTLSLLIITTATARQITLPDATTTESVTDAAADAAAMPAAVAETAEVAAVAETAEDHADELPLPPPPPLRLDQLRRYKVQNPQGEDLGQIVDVVLDPELRNVRYVILSFGGFLGIGKSQFAIPWQRLDIDPQQQLAIINVQRLTLKQARGFRRHQWPAAEKATPQPATAE